jgi:hypothetical protein
LVLLIADLFQPLDNFTVELFLNGDMGHGRGGTGPMPMFLSRRDPDHVTRSNFLNGAAPALHPAAASRYNEGLAQRVRVPDRPGAGLERDTAPGGACRIVDLKQWINPNCAGKPIGRSFAGRL